jgi:hypothetical protein
MINLSGSQPLACIAGLSSRGDNLLLCADQLPKALGCSRRDSWTRSVRSISSGRGWSASTHPPWISLFDRCVRDCFRRPIPRYFPGRRNRNGPIMALNLGLSIRGAVARAMEKCV